MPKMVRLVNTNPLGAVELPLLRRVLAPGEEFEVPEAQAENLLSQVGNYAPAPSKSNKPAAPAADPAQEG